MIGFLLIVLGGCFWIFAVTKLDMFLGDNYINGDGYNVRLDNKNKKEPES